MLQKKRPGIGLRILLVVPQIVALLGALSLCAAGYAFDFRATFGPLVVLLWLVSWGALWTAHTMRGIPIFCVLVSAQAGPMAFAAIRYQAEDKLVREVVAGAEERKKQWAAKMAQYDTDLLHEMMNGSRPVALQELNEMNAPAKGGQAALRELVSAEKQRESKGLTGSRR